LSSVALARHLGAVPHSVAVSSLLIVDDNREMRQLIRSIVRDVTDHVVECDDGSEALAAYRAHRPEWVLMDVEMTGMDGLQATRAITAQFPDARIVIVTQHTDAGTRSAAVAAGATGFVSKDNLVELRTLLRQQEKLS
jgi:two-component system response regulator DegU